MDYEKKYKDALEIARKINSGEGVAAPPDWTSYEVIFPELKESEDERVRKAIIRILKGETGYTSKEDTDKYVTWLENQREKSVNIDIESMVSSYKQRLKSQGDIKNSSLVNMCLTAFRHGVENVLEELNLKKFEKQGEKVTNINGEDYGIDGLYHAIKILERTVGRVTGYQSDDGILSHKAAINAVKDLYEKQGEIEPKTLYADKVIAWLVANICDFEYYVTRFKKDFGL